MKIRVQRGRFPQDGRAILFSDIHGNAGALREVLMLIEPSGHDVLFPVGDYLERGEDSLGVVRSMMTLCEKREAYPLQGNVDSYVLWMLNNDSSEANQALRYALAAGNKRFAVQARELLELRDPLLYPEPVDNQTARLNPTTYFATHQVNAQREAESFNRFRERVWKAFGKELIWLRKLPTIVDAGPMVFVHGGLPPQTALFTEQPSLPVEMTEEEPSPSRTDWEDCCPTHSALKALENRDVFTVQKNDHFMDQGLGFDRWVAVGHWPVFNYRSRYPSELPFVDSHRHIIGLDGGCSVKSDGGQLNALIIGDSENHYPETSCNLFPMPRILGREVCAVYADSLPRATALDAQESSEIVPVSIRWGDNDVRILERREGRLYIRHLSSGRQLWVPEQFLFTEGDPARIRDISDHIPAIPAGAPIRIVAETKCGTIVKYGGIKGFYNGRFTIESK